MNVVIYPEVLELNLHCAWRYGGLKWEYMVVKLVRGLGLHLEGRPKGLNVGCVKLISWNRYIYATRLIHSGAHRA